MSKRKRTGIVFIPFILSVAAFTVFNSEIKSQPNDAGFWIILAMGISIGLLLKVFFKK